MEGNPAGHNRSGGVWGGDSVRLVARQAQEAEHALTQPPSHTKYRPAAVRAGISVRACCSPSRPVVESKQALGRRASRARPRSQGGRAMRFGSGSFTYEVVEGWGKLPEGWDLVEYRWWQSTHRTAFMPSIAASTRWSGTDRDGNFVTHWGEGCSPAHMDRSSVRTMPSIASTTATTRCASARQRARC